MKRSMVVLCFVGVIGVFGAEARGEGEDQITVNSTGESGMSEKNHQDDVLSNPETSGAARAGRNSAIINQSGYSNVSSVVQEGDDNVAEQTQTGEYNELRVEQRGKHNRSLESQTGKHNRKTSVQNGSETIIEQVNP